MTQPIEQDTDLQMNNPENSSSLWQRELEQRGATLERGHAVRFTDLQHEVEALGNAGLVPLLGTTPLQLTGADRLEFLHGQVSHEVKRLQPGESRPALMLNVKGHALALMRIYRRDDDLFVVVEGDAGKQVRAQLRTHIIFDQVEITNLSQKVQTLTLQGASAGEVVRQTLQTELPGPNAFVQAPFGHAKVLVAAVPRSRAGGYDLHVLSPDAPALLDALQEAGAELAGETALAAVRVAAGIAEGELEGGEGVLPQEAGLEYALSYRKGCYLGQEIMARVEARGRVRRRLVGLRLDARPEVGMRDVLLNGKKVGRLGTVAEHPSLGPIALASIRTEVEAGAQLEVAGVGATLTELPFEL